MGIRKRREKILEVDKHRQLAAGLVEYLFECRNGANRKIHTTATTQEEVEIMIEEYLNTLEDIPITYTRNAYISDLLLLMKTGNTGVAKIVGDTLGFLSASNDLVINTIDFKEVSDTIIASMEPDPMEDE